MARAKVDQYSTNPDANTDVGGINIGEGSLARDSNNAKRQLMAHIAATPLREDPADMRTALGANNASNLNTGTVPESVLRDGTKSLASVIAASFDIDTLKTNGRYYLSGVTVPGYGAFYGFVEVFFVAGGYGRHEYHYYNSEGASYVRYCDVNVWGSVKKLQVTQGEQDARYAQMPQTAAGNGQFVAISTADGVGYTLPSGGTWLWWAIQYVTASGAISSGAVSDIHAGGTPILGGYAGYRLTGFAWRISE